MLFMTVFAANAQSRPWIGDSVQYLPKGIGKGAYHLQVTSVGNFAVTNKRVLALNEYGYLQLRDSGYIHEAGKYQQLREAMWCVEVSQENLGQTPTYVFKNKEYSVDMSVMNASFLKTAFCPSASPVLTDNVVQQKLFDPSAKGKDVVGMVYNIGENLDWWFSGTYNTSPLERNVFLRVEIPDEPDYFLTFATDYQDATPDSVYLVKAHANDFKPGADLYDNYLLRFTLKSAAPRVLNAKEFNTKLYERATEDWVSLQFNPEVSENQTNVFSQPLWAENVSGTSKDGQYLYMKTKANNYLYVDREYYNAAGHRYPIIKDDKAKNTTSNEGEFRFVYYPTEDSLVINVREIKNHPEYGDARDRGGYNQGDNLYTMEIWNSLIVRMQDLDNNDGRVITVYNKPANTRASFGIHDCEVYDENRTTIEPDLYTIQDEDGRYLVVPLAAGDFSPQWKRLDVDNLDKNDTIEVAFKTPSYQWFVTKVHKDSKTSRIHLTNREFNFIRLEYIQIHNTPTIFTGTWSFLSDSLNLGANYRAVYDSRKVAASGFTKVVDDPKAAAKKAEIVQQLGSGWNKTVGSAKHQVEAWMQYMPEDLLHKLYRTSPFLGYKAVLPDTLNYYGYAFNLLHKYNEKNWYFGVTDNRSIKDTTLYVDEERTFFELMLPDTLRAYGREKYGIGHTTNDLYQQAYNDYGIDYIAPLERYFYYFKINDYYKYSRNDNFLVLEDNQRYVYVDEATANSRKLNKAKFYMRFTYEKNNREYYSLLDRIDKSNFEYLTKTFGLAITDTLKAFDDSHGGIKQNSFGVLQAAVNDLNLYVQAKVKATIVNSNISTFAIRQMDDELYRRFNTDKEECGRGEVGDEPRTLKFYRYSQPEYLVFEDAHSGYYVPGSGINFMGVENENVCNANNGQWHTKHNYAIYVDTAYVNRGTGHIKPQYLLVVDPQIVRGGVGCNTCGDSIDFIPYVYGRYLRNMTDSARVNGVPGGKILNNDYLYNTTWERLAFVEAFHAGDSLYLLNGTPIESLYAKDKDGNNYLNLALVKKYPKIKIVALDNNLHKDEVFSMRFVDRQRDKVGNKIDNARKVFLMESETTNRDYTKGRMIAPLEGGWVKYQNGVAMMSRGSYKDNIDLAEHWEVACASVSEKPTANEDAIAEKVVVVSGNGSVTILNANGKRVVISNVLGQTIANEVLTSDNAVVNAPKGVVIVAVDGEDAIKTIVK